MQTRAALSTHSQMTQKPPHSSHKPTPKAFASRLAPLRDNFREIAIDSARGLSLLIEAYRSRTVQNRTIHQRQLWQTLRLNTSTRWSVTPAHLSMVSSFSLQARVSACPSSA